MTSGPSPDDRIDGYMTSLFRRGENPAFLDTYGEFLKEMASLGCASFGTAPTEFSFYEHAAEIPLDFLKHRDNLDESTGEMSPGNGRTIIDHLSLLARIASTSTGPEQRQALVILREIITELRYPFTTTQDTHGTCAPEAMSNQLLLNSPAEWTRIAVALLQDGEAKTFDSSKMLRPPSDINKPDGSNDRSVTAAFFQAAVKATYPKPGCTYENARDKYIDGSGKAHDSGMDLPQIREAREALFGKGQVIKATQEEWVKNPPIGGLFTSITWVEGKGKKPPIGHALIVVSYDARTDRVIFRNPQRNQDWVDGDDIFDEGPVRTCHESETGLESMDLREFLRRSPISLLDTSEIAAYNPPLAELKPPQPSGKGGFRSFLKPTALVVGGLVSVTGVGYHFLTRTGEIEAPPPAVSSATGGSPSGATALTTGPAPVVSTSVQDMFGNEGNLLGSHQWQAVFGETVDDCAVPKELTEELASGRSPLAEDGGKVFDNHRLILIPPKIDLEILAGLANKAGAFLELGESLHEGEVNRILGRNSLRAESAKWALVHRSELVSSELMDRLKGESITSMQFVLAKQAPNYRVASVAETVIAALYQLAEGGSVEDFVMLCRDTTSGTDPLCVKYDSKRKMFTVGTEIDVGISEVRAGFSYNLSK
jgi:hypothetical protein